MRTPAVYKRWSSSPQRTQRFCYFAWRRPRDTHPGQRVCGCTKGQSLSLGWGRGRVKVQRKGKRRGGDGEGEGASKDSPASSGAPGEEAPGSRPGQGVGEWRRELGVGRSRLFHIPRRRGGCGDGLGRRQGQRVEGREGVGAANGVHRALGGPRKAPRGRAGAGGGQGRGGRTPRQRRGRPAPGAGGLAGKVAPQSCAQRWALFSEGSLAGACTFLFALAKPKVIQFALITTISPELSPDSDRRSL